MAWICLNNGFYSIINHPKDKDKLLVRTRNPEHLKALFGDDVKIEVSPKRDYHYRTVADRKLVSELIASRLQNINYDNFKNSVEDDDLHDLYASFWEDHWHYQGLLEDREYMKAHKGKHTGSKATPSKPDVDLFLHLRDKK